MLFKKIIKLTTNILEYNGSKKLNIERRHVSPVWGILRNTSSFYQSY